MIVNFWSETAVFDRFKPEFPSIPASALSRDTSAFLSQGKLVAGQQNLRKTHVGDLIAGSLFKITLQVLPRFVEVSRLKGIEA